MSILAVLPTLQQHMWGDGSWGWGGWLAMMLMMALFWGAVLIVGVWAFRGAGHHRPGVSAGTSPSALDIARERYARGEIGDEEFERIKRGLS